MEPELYINPTPTTNKRKNASHFHYSKLTTICFCSNKKKEKNPDVGVYIMHLYLIQKELISLISQEINTMSYEMPKDNNNGV
uniref:Uncharacterized protein n=1 Tax=Nelumbo nucifera TaxID=4432 RepID=A0A822XXQ8_NELNU|nr:TPA_asm: hypothetical protein HUJ06_025249 [Nelumbo nucifera]